MCTELTFDAAGKPSRRVLGTTKKQLGRGAQSTSPVRLTDWMHIIHHHAHRVPLPRDYNTVPRAIGHAHMGGTHRQLRAIVQYQRPRNDLKNTEMSDAQFVIHEQELPASVMVDPQVTQAVGTSGECLR